jgi:hypothetical protein
MIPLIVLVITIWLLVLLLKWKLPFLIGKSGERFVSGKLLDLNRDQYRVIDDLMLPSLGSIDTTQIDHVIVSNFGVFCIETKSYSGWIFGNVHQQHWTQVIYRYKKKFYNPLRQNYAHIKAIEKVIGVAFPQVPIHGFVAFPSAGKLQVSGTDNVGQARDIVAKIRAFSTLILSDSDRDKIFELLITANILDKEKRKTHVRNAHEVKTSRDF